MADLLVDYIRSNIWCTPDQDRQLILQPQRLTRSAGGLNTVKIMAKIFDLPTKKERYHVFQVGYRHPKALGLMATNLEEITSKWVSVTDAINNENVMVDIYTDSGVQIPRYNVYYMYTSDNNFVFAVREDTSVEIDFKTETLFFRLYSNAYFESTRSASSDKVYVSGGKMWDTSHILALQNEYETYVGQPGCLTAFVNGVMVKAINLASVKAGDSAEFIYDASGFRTVDIPVSSLLVFQGTLDNEQRYLCHYPWQNANDDKIIYHDDIDFYVVYDVSSTKRVGLYYHKNKVRSVRMVTHRDYSLSVDNVYNVFSALKEITGIDDIDYQKIKIRLNIRKSGYDRPLVYEASKIHELYKLPDDKLLQAMEGVNSTVSVWTAEALEASGYSETMAANWKGLNRSLAERCLGYNAIAKYIGDTPSPTTFSDGRYFAELPAGMRGNSTAFMYGFDGLLAAWSNSSKANRFFSTTVTTKNVEFISGHGAQQPENLFGISSIEIPSNCSYRVYMCHRGSTVVDNKWVDITDSGKYTVTGDTLEWVGADESQYLMVRTDRSFLCYDFTVSAYRGLIKFNIQEIQNRASVVDLHNVEVPYGEYDIFMDGRSLIEGIDYTINGCEVVIISKKYFDYSVPHNITIRGYGFCNSDFTRNVPDDIGFIEYGYLSNNNRHDLRDDRVLNIVVDGLFRTRDDFEFSEQHTGVSVVNDINGLPYRIKDIVVPMRAYTNTDTYALKKTADAVDLEISEYLSLYLPENDRDGADAISALNPVYSPFISAVLSDVVSGVIPAEKYTMDISSLRAEEVVEDYMYLLKYDPTQPAFKDYQDYFEIQPSVDNNVRTLNIYQLRFMRRLVDLYCNGLVDLSTAVILEEI